ncbi:hypothetical protein [Nitrosopumilus piranensis]|uniref:Uncharacterized protein n=1 Tax=Nitrosopumilus piranensis TaxID=1582439 RepID=A0A0C5BQZ0_9ARCH|nr:hypothetical protein [Nitrosopumilus piranensis]AJM92173.1 hypothetical protein NPIRD3C_0961 [Nitrosopumilus piranensis]
MSKKEEDDDEGKVFDPFFEKSGNGKIVWDDGFENEVKFSIKLNRNGYAQGNLECHNIPEPGALLEHLKGKPQYKTQLLKNLVKC